MEEIFGAKILKETYKFRLTFVFVLNLAFNVWINYEAYTSLDHYKANQDSDDYDDAKYKSGRIFLIISTVIGGLILILAPVILFSKRYD